MKARAPHSHESWRITTEGSGEVQININDGDSYFLKSYIQPELDEWVLREPELVYGDIKPLVQYLGYSQHDLASVLEVDPSTLFRWSKENKQIGKMKSKAMFEIDHIIARGVSVFGDEASFKEWLDTNNSALGGQKPFDLLKSPYGIDLVRNAIEALLWGNII